MSVNYFVGRKFVGRELNSAISKPKFRFRKLEDTIDNIENIVKDISVITFDDSNSVYVGAFFVADDNFSEKNKNKSKDYKMALNEVEKDFARIYMSSKNIIIEKTVEMR